MILPLLLGAAGGLGVALCVVGMLSRPGILGVALRQLQTPNWNSASAPTASRWRSTMSRLTGAPSDRLMADLRVVDRTAEAHSIDKLQTAVFWSAMPLSVGVLAGLGGWRISPGLLTVATLAGAVGGWIVSDHQLRQRAFLRRREFRSTLVTYVQLVAILLAGGAGVNQALADAASYGHGWAFTVIRRSLQESSTRSQSPWAGFAAVAERMQLQELEELSASMRLAGESGAHVRRSLLAKAESLRIHEITEIEAEAASSSEKMGGPVGAMVIGFVVIMGYPALAAILEL